MGKVHRVEAVTYDKMIRQRIRLALLLVSVAVALGVVAYTRIQAIPLPQGAPAFWGIFIGGLMLLVFGSIAVHIYFTVFALHGCVPERTVCRGLGGEVIYPGTWFVRPKDEDEVVTIPLQGTGEVEEGSLWARFTFEVADPHSEKFCNWMQSSDVNISGYLEEHLREVFRGILEADDPFAAIENWWEVYKEFVVSAAEKNGITVDVVEKRAAGSFFESTR